MDELIDMDSEFEPTMENYQDSLFVAGRPCKASDDDDEEEEEEENSSYRPADSSAQTSGIAPYVEVEAASVAMTTLATELTDEEIRDVQEMGVKLQEFVLDSAEDEELQATHDEDSSAQLPTELEKRPKASETDVDDIMSDSFTLASAVDCSQNDRSDVKESERHRETSLPLDDDDDDDENDMKELLRFKRQNSRDYLEQAPIDGLLEGIAEEPEDEGTKEIEEEYDSVVIKDEEDESGSVSDAANDTGKETEESEAVDNPSPSVVDVVTSDEAVTATVVDVDGEDDVEVPLDAIQTAEPCDLHEPQNGEFSEDDVVDHTTEVSSQKQETEEGEGLTVSAEPAVEPMDTTTSPSSSGTTSDENAATFDVAKGSDKASADELTITTSQSKNRNHDYVNIGDLDAPSNDLDAETVRRAAKAEISDEDFCFDETPTKSSERPDASCDYVNVDTIRANKRLVSRMIQEGNDEEFERLEAEIISKLEDEEDSDYCVPKSTPVEAKSGDTELKQFADINGSAATDENENLSLSGHQDLLAADVALADETSNLPETLKSLDNTRNEEFKEDEQTSDISASVKEFGQWTCEKTSKENGSSEQAVDSDDEIIINYKHHESQKAISIHEQEKMLREEIESCRDDLSLKESFGLQHVKKSNLKSDHSRLASPAYETSSGVRTNDILPEAGSVKALVAQWQQMESKRWSRKDDMKVQNGGEQAESRGMNRSRSCGPLPRKIRVLSPDGVLDDEGRRINDWTVVGGGGEGGDLQEQYNSQPSLTRAMLVKFERLDYETSTSVKQAPPPTKKTFKWEVKEMKTLNRPGFLAH